MELFANGAATTVPAGGTASPAPSAGTVETWTVATADPFPAVSAAAHSQIHVIDAARPSELHTVIDMAGTAWQVVRGAEGTTPVTHDPGFTIQQVITAGMLSGVEQSFNILSFGAVIDGVTDDLSAWQAAINAAQAEGGGIVFHPGGVSVVSGTPQITGSNVVIRGAGRDKAVILLAPQNVTPDGHTIGLWVNGASNVTIENLCVDGNFAGIAQDGGTVIPSTFGGGAAQTTQPMSGAPAAGATETLTVNAAARDASAAHSTPFAFKVDSEWVLCTAGFGTLSWTVRRGFSIGTPGSGAVAAHSAGATIAATHGTLFDPVITAYGYETPKTYLSSMYAGGVDASTYLQYRVPVRVTSSDNVVVRNCMIRNSISAGVLADSPAVNGCRDVLVMGCWMQNTWDNAIYFHGGCQFCIASGNLITGAMYNGLCSVYCDHILFTGNNLRGCGPSFSDSGGIQVNGSSYCTVAANSIDNCVYYGVQAEASNETNLAGGAAGNLVYSSHTLITGNQISRCNAADFPTHSADGVQVFGAVSTIADGNIITGCDHGVSAGSKALDTFITGNKITGCKSLGVNVGESADVIGTVVAGNLIAFNGSSGIYSGAPLVAAGNTIIRNVNQGIQLAGVPAGLPGKTDFITGNLISGNTDSGVLCGGGAAGLAVVERNVFTNEPGVLISDGQIAYGDATLYSPSAPFTASDAGRAVILLNQGSYGITTATVIDAYTDASHVELHDTAQATETGVTFWISRGPAYFSDGSTTTAANSQLNSASAAFTTADAGRLVVLLSKDPDAAPLGAFTVASYVSSTQVTLSGNAGTITACGFWINRAAGQTGKAVNNYNGNPLITRDNTYHGLPELQDASGVRNWVPRGTARLARRPVADTAYTVQPGDELVAYTAMAASRTVTLPAGLGTATQPYYLDVKDESGSCSGTNTIVLSVSGGGALYPAGTSPLNTAYASARLYSTGSNWYAR